LTDSWITRANQDRPLWAMGLVAATAPVLAAAGGLGLAPLALIAAIVILPPPDAWRAHARLTTPLILFTALLVWMAVTLAWTPSGWEQYAKVIMMAAVGAALLAGLAWTPEAKRLWPRMAVIATVTALAAILVIEALSGSFFTTGIKQLPSDSQEVLRNIGRGATIYVVLLGPACAIAMSQLRQGVWLAAGLVAAGAIAAFSFELAANALAFGAAFAAFWIARWRPRATIYGLGLIMAAWIIGAPAAVIALEPSGEAFRGSLALSWEMRWESWTYARELLAQKPITGWGVDAARTFDDTVTLRGFEVPRMPLHPHSAALQLWLELGLVGAILAAGAILSAAERLARNVTPVQAAGMAAAGTAVAVISFVTYGVWQEWWWATASLAAGACALIPRGPESS